MCVCVCVCVGVTIVVRTVRRLSKSTFVFRVPNNYSDSGTRTAVITKLRPGVGGFLVILLFLIEPFTIIGGPIPLFTLFIRKTLHTCTVP